MLASGRTQNCSGVPVKELTVSPNGIAERARFSSAVSALLALFIVGATAQEPAALKGYKLPTKEQKLDSKGLERVLSAKTVALVVSSVPLLRKDDKGNLTITGRTGRLGPERAKADVEKVLSEWGAFSLVDDPAQADLVLLIEEQTLAPNMFSEGRTRLRHTLVVFPTGGPGAAPPIWVGIDTQNAMMASWGAKGDGEGVVKKLRRDIENARNRAKK